MFHQNYSYKFLQVIDLHVWIYLVHIYLLIYFLNPISNYQQSINKHESITRDDIEEAIKKVTVGLEKHSRVVSEKDKKLTAYHEAGHAVVSRYLETQNDIKEVSIYTSKVLYVDIRNIQE